MNVAVVGGGTMGLCTARELVNRGHAVTVFEQHEPGTMFGSSFGRSRIVRQAYPDQFYTEILLSGHKLWYELEAESGEKFVHETGLLFVGPKDGTETWEELDVLRNLDVPHKVLTSQDIESVHSCMTLQPSEIAIMTLSAGWADVPAILRHLRRHLEGKQCPIMNQRITNLPELRREFDRVILAAGAWVSKFVDAPVTVTQQTFAYLNFTSVGPVWIEGFGDHIYGFPSEPGQATSKIGYHTAGPVRDPDSPDRTPDPMALNAILEAANRRFDGTRRVFEIVEAASCLYTSTANDDFRLAWLDDKTLMVSPCSGHGFKFGPWIGQLVANLLCGEDDLANWPRFRF